MTARSSVCACAYACEMMAPVGEIQPLTVFLLMLMLMKMPMKGASGGRPAALPLFF